MQRFGPGRPARPTLGTVDRNRADGVATVEFDDIGDRWIPTPSDPDAVARAMRSEQSCGPWPMELRVRSAGQCTWRSASGVRSFRLG